MQVIPRRDALFSLGASVGGVALSALLAGEARADAAAKPLPTDPKPGHLPARAKRCIFLTMEGGPSHIDTFDPKPKLRDVHLQEFVSGGEMKSAMESGKRYFVESPFTFARRGESGAWMGTNWEHLAGVADDLCFYRGCQAESVNHPTAMAHVNTGNRFPGDPAVGAWVTYGLGSLNSDLPAFVVLPEVSHPQGGAANWGNGFLPANFQGTALRAEGSPILNLAPPKGVTRAHQRENLDLLAELNRRHAADRLAAGDPFAAQLEARVQSYELAFRMQAKVPGLIDVDAESDATKSLYGVDETDTDAFGRKCLLARRLVERGVRFVQLYHGTWDSHDQLGRAHGNLIRQTDKPIAGLLKDLKRRGLLDDTLVVWTGEFGRSPDNSPRGGVAYGRDHNAKAMCVWMAGGGVNAGHTVGATDELGGEAVECVHPLRDLHVTLLHLLGLDDNRLTYFSAGRFKQLSQFGGELIPELLA